MIGGVAFSENLKLEQGKKVCMIQNKESMNDEAVNQSEKEQGEFPAQEHIAQIKRLRKGCSSLPKKEVHSTI